jgi:hypothetical protein
MLEIAGGLVLFFIGLFLLQAVLIGIDAMFRALNDRYYSARRWRKAVDPQESESPKD